MHVIPLYSEPALMKELTGETLTLIHATTEMNAIKKLVTAYEILNLNLEIMNQFAMMGGFPPWDICTLQDLNTIRRELVVYHRIDFNPTRLVEQYSSKTGTLIRLVGLRIAPQLLNEA